MSIRKSKWFQPGFAVLLGLVTLGAQWLGGHPDRGIGSFAIMATFGAVLAFGGRSETIRDLRSDDRDERMNQIQLRAVALAGHVTITAVVIGFLVEIARGHDGHPFTWLVALAAVTYLVALRVLQARG